MRLPTGSAVTWVKVVAIFAAGALIGAISAIQVAPSLQRTNTVAVGPGSGPGGNPSAEGGAGTTSPGATAAPGVGGGPAAGGPAAGSSFQCAAGRNGGVTDKGVTGSSIKLATTV